MQRTGDLGNGDKYSFEAKVSDQYLLCVISIFTFIHENTHSSSTSKYESFRLKS